MDKPTESKIGRFIADLRSLPNESSKTHRFSQLIGELFPDSANAIKFSKGIENRIQIYTGSRLKLGRADNYFGQAVIEFENSLAATGKHAEQQLREYVSGIWTTNSVQRKSFLCIASDGIKWIIYKPTISDESLATVLPDNISLVPIRSIQLRPSTIHEFYLWLTSFLFRPKQVTPTSSQLQEDFGTESPIFNDAITAITAAWDVVKNESTYRTGFHAWSNYLQYTYGSVRTGLTRHYLKHTYLVSIARLVVWAALSGGKTDSSLEKTAKSVLSGHAFRAYKITNIVEHDFFQWILDENAQFILAPLWEKILNSLLTYDLSNVGRDLLKGVYQDLIDPEDRHDLGEFYTPDWLCHLVVKKTLPPKGLPKVIDPACGSGSFLVAALEEIRKRGKRRPREKLLTLLLESVVGIDIHPVAVTIARANYTLSIADLIKKAPRSVDIPVYLADSLFLPKINRQLSLMGENETYEIDLADNRTVQLPGSLAAFPAAFDQSVNACAALADSIAQGNSESEAGLKNFLQKQIPEFKKIPNNDDMTSALWGFTLQLADLIRQNKDSIWPFVIKNAFRPAMMRGRFDALVGNPPWLSYRFIGDPRYQSRVKELIVGRYKIAPKSQRLITQMEMGTLFLVHTISTFGNNKARIGFVLPRSVLTADQHTKLREGSYNAPLKISSFDDLDGIAPLFKVPCCVVYGDRQRPVKLPKKVPFRIFSGKLQRRDASWADLAKDIQAKPAIASLIYLGHRTALSTEKGRHKPNEPSPYSARFHQGATIVPRSLYFVQSDTVELGESADALYWVKSSDDAIAEAKKPYKNISLEGEVEGRFLFLTALSKDLMPFGLVGTRFVVLPLDRVNGEISLLSQNELRQEGYRGMATWIASAEMEWRRGRGAKVKKQSLYERLDYHKELTSQNVKKRYLVVYNHSGKNVSAAAVDRQSYKLPFVVDVKMYWADCANLSEADYVTAILNSREVNKAIKPFQNRGLLGERDIHKKVLDLPFPSYDPKSPIHVSIAKSGRSAAEITSKFNFATGKTVSLGRLRRQIRDELEGVLDGIDAKVHGLLKY